MTVEDTNRIPSSLHEIVQHQKEVAAHLHESRQHQKRFTEVFKPTPSMTGGGRRSSVTVEAMDDVSPQWACGPVFIE